MLLVRKLGVPFHPELAFGAIGEGGVRVINRTVVRGARLGDREMAATEAEQWAELHRRSERFRGDQSRYHTAERFAEYADEVVCLATPGQYFAVGQGYRHFPQTSDDEVVELLIAHPSP